MRIVITGDWHIPNEDTDKIEEFFKHFEELKPDRLIINGDFVDCSEISRFRKNPITTVSLKNEISFAKEYFARIRKLYPDIPIDYIEGNHEMRIKTSTMEDNPELYFLFEDEFLSEKGLDLKRFNVTYLPCPKHLSKFSHNYIEVDKWLIGHFDKSLKQAGYTARMLRDEFGANIIQGHSHKVGSSCRNYHDGVKCGYEISCLCDFKKTFINTPDWTHGFGLLENNKFYQIVL